MATAIPVGRAIEPCAWPGIESFEENLRVARRAATTARHAAEDAVEGATLTIRKHPLRAVGLAAVAGAVTGTLVGFGAGWFARTRG